MFCRCLQLDSIKFEGEHVRVKIFLPKVTLETGKKLIILRLVTIYSLQNSILDFRLFS